MGERAKVSHKRLFAPLTPEKTAAGSGKRAANASVHAPKLSTDRCQHPFV